MDKIGIQRFEATSVIAELIPHRMLCGSVECMEVEGSESKDVPQVPK